MRPLADAWVQTFAFLAVASGGLAAYARIAAPAGSAAPAAASAPSPARAGRRVLVDARLARDADTSDLSAAVFAAKSGDTVYVRAGVYHGQLRPAPGVALVGVGDPARIVVEAPADKPLIYAEGDLSIASMTLQGGAPAVFAGSGARLAMQDVSISGQLGGVVVAGPGAKARLTRVRVLRSDGDGVAARDGASVELDRSELLGQKGCGLSLTKASAVLRRSTLSLNGYGVCADTASSLDAGDSDLNGNLRGPRAVHP